MKKVKYLDMDELAIRIALACNGMNQDDRPSDDGHACMVEIENLNPETAKRFRNAAVVATKFIAETASADVEERLVSDGGRQ